MAEALAINHLNLVVADLQKSLDFYVSKLGFRYVRPLHARKVILEYGGFDFFLEQADGVQPHPRFHFGLKTTVAGVHQFAELLRSHDIRLVPGNNPNRLAEIYVTDDGVRHVLYFEDPDGYTIEVYSHIGNS
jgi:catechol 2,3-dioxygenase-like lactoylglutathione lyase family enzyme